MILIFLALTILDLTKTELVDTIETSDSGIFGIVNTEIWYGNIEWNATQGDSLMTDGIPIGTWDYNKIYLKNVQNLAIGYVVENNLPINNWELVIPNTNDTTQMVKVFKPLNKLVFKIGFKAKTTGMRTIKIWVIRYRY